MQTVAIKAMKAPLPTAPEVIATDPIETLSSGFLRVPKMAVAKMLEGRTERDGWNGSESPAVVSSAAEIEMEGRLRGFRYPRKTIQKSVCCD
jgi:hypothetical protein